MSLTIHSAVAWFLALYFSGVALFYTVRLVGDRTGRQLVHHGERFSRHWVGHTAFRVFRIAIWLICVVRVVWPSFDHFLGVFPLAYSSPITLSGCGLLLLGFGLAVMGHRALGRHWRSGIDQKATAEIVDSGLYRYSRNPIFAGVLIAQLGFFLALPSVFTLVCLAAGWLSIANQVRLEEAHLLNAFGARYESYRRRVDRWWTFDTAQG